MQDIEKFLEDTIEKFTGVQIENKEKNILKMGVMPLELLYVIDEIEEKYGITVKELLADSDYTILSIRNLSCRIGELISES